MNNQRRKRIIEVIEKLQGFVEEVEMLRDEEQEAFDNLPEGLQGSEKGEAIEENVNDLEEALRCIEEGRDILDAVSCR